MALIRPAGMSDEDTDSDDEFFDEPRRKYFPLVQASEKKKLENSFQTAIINGNISEFEDLITKELNNEVDIKLDSGWTLLMHACSHAQHQIVKYLLDKGANPNLHADSVTPIMVACSNSSADDDAIYKTVSHLIDKQCLLNIGDKYGQTPLMRAINSGRVDIVNKLIDMKVNIETRDVEGWTPLFWAVHHNQPEILEALISHGARLTEVDKAARSALQIAKSHDYENIIAILNKHLNIVDDNDEDAVSGYDTQMSSWYDYYPGITKAGKPNYTSEIPPLLYGMNCEQLGAVIKNSGMDLRTFLLLEGDDMTRLGIHMQFQRRRLQIGLLNFHKRTWRLNAVAGLFAPNNNNFSVLECLTSLGSHLQQVYIVEATLQYCMRRYDRIQSQLKFEPPHSPVLATLNAAANKLHANINNLRGQIGVMKKILKKISASNPQPADLIKERTISDVAVSYITEAVLICTLALAVYHTRGYIISVFAK